MKALLLNVHENRVSEVDVETLDDYYRLIQCSCIDIVLRKVGKKYYCFVCDDEALLHSNIKISAIDSSGEMMLAGNLIILNSSNNGDMESLTDEDIKNIKDNLYFSSIPLYPFASLILCNVEY